MAPKIVAPPPASADNVPQLSTISLAIWFFLLRLYNAFGLRTFFQPDEYFQALEPAWAAAFGANSGAWITWEWREHLRSSLHPLLFTGVYKVAAYYCDSLDLPQDVRAQILIAAPKVLQASFAACIDLFTYRLAGKIYGKQSSVALAALFLTVFSPWQWFCSVRTFSNSVETSSTVAALDLWPWDWFFQMQAPSGKPSNDSKKDQQPLISSGVTAPTRLYASLVLAAIACILRPTNIIIWTTISSVLVLKSANPSETITNLLTAAALSGSAVLALSVGIDRAYYGGFVLPPLRFLQFNVVESLSGFYGVNRLHYYVTEGVALLLTAALPFAVVGLYTSLRASNHQTASKDAGRESMIRSMLSYTVLLDILVLSLIAHKEVRFIYPLLPMLHVLAAKPVATFFNPTALQAQRYRGLLLTLAFAANLVIGHYASSTHQRGVMDVMHYLRSEYEVRYQPLGPNHGNMTVGFLMPCHSTPWRSHFVHPEIDAWALTCEPPLRLSKEERKDYLDEADVFYADPLRWIGHNMEDWKTTGSFSAESKRRDVAKRAWPQYVVFFEQLEPTIKKALGGGKYEQCWRGFNTHWHDDWRRKGDVVVWCRGRDW